MSKFKVGQRVWSVLDGWGIVEHSSTVKKENDNYPVCVRFDNKQTEHYTGDGKWREFDLRPTLFFDEPKEWPDPPAPLPDIAIDTPIWCRWGGKWVPRHFACIINNKVSVFANGKTSHTAAICDTSTADEWSLTKPISKETSNAD
jgi:hypothetical protein